MSSTVAIDLVVAPNPFGNELVEGVKEVQADLLVVVLVDNDRRSGMGHIHATETLVDVRAPHRFGDLRGEINDFVSFAGADLELHFSLQLSRCGLCEASGMASFRHVYRHT